MSAVRLRALATATYHASSLARFVRSHGVPCRVVVGRKRGAVHLRVAIKHGGGWLVETIPAKRYLVREMLGY